MIKRYLLVIFLLLLTPLSATYIYIFDEKKLDKERQVQLFDLILRGESPRAFYNASPLDLESECHKLAPSLCLEWIPPSIWQIAVVHAFFHDEQIRNHILACAGQGWDPVEFESIVHSRLPLIRNIEEIAESFDHQSQSLPNLSDLFFQVNEAVVALYKRVNGSDLEMLRLAISELPPFDEWQKKQFPFWRSPWIYNPNSAQIFFNGLKDENLLVEIVKIERSAHENGEWVLYRGYPGSGYPSTLQLDDKGSHALSFGSTLLGGTFFSLEATALTYSRPDTSMTSHRFLALSVTPQELKEIFRIGPLHPFVQMLVNGEMFHAHTKIAASKAEDITTNGYFMECNKHCNDPVGYICTFTMTPEELEKAFLSLCKRSGHIFN